MYLASSVPMQFSQIEKIVSDERHSFTPLSIASFE